jgi:hypothetical protein
MILSNFIRISPKSFFSAAGGSGGGATRGEAWGRHDWRERRRGRARLAVALGSVACGGTTGGSGGRGSCSGARGRQEPAQGRRAAGGSGGGSSCGEARGHARLAGAGVGEARRR